MKKQLISLSPSGSGGAGGTKKYLHRVRIYLSYRLLNDVIPENHAIYVYISIITDSQTAFTRDALIDYIQTHNNDYINNPDVLSTKSISFNHNGIAFCQQLYYSNGGLFLAMSTFEPSIVEGAITIGSSYFPKYAYKSQTTSYWDIKDIVTEL